MPLVIPQEPVLTLDGVTKPRVSWAEEFGIHPDTVRSRMQRGWSVEEALKGKT